jgi:hypothetical protein
VVHGDSVAKLLNKIVVTVTAFEQTPEQNLFTANEAIHASQFWSVR